MKGSFEEIRFGFNCEPENCIQDMNTYDKIMNEIEKSTSNNSGNERRAAEIAAAHTRAFKSA